jgi:hypothetical protein
VRVMVADVGGELGGRHAVIVGDASGGGLGS